MITDTVELAGFNFNNTTWYMDPLLGDSNMDGAYLLRLHRRTESARWRASLENAHTGELLQFGSHADLLLYLFQLLSEESGRPQVINNRHSITQTVTKPPAKSWR